MTSNEKTTERLTVDLEADVKQKLRVVTAMKGERHMQKAVIALINEAYERLGVTSIPAGRTHPQANFEDAKTLQTNQ